MCDKNVMSMLWLFTNEGAIMGKDSQQVSSIDLTSLVESHDKPFVVIDSNYRILAVNSAYEQVYGAVREDAVGRMCYQVSHGNDHPCSEDGEECPYDHVFETGDPYVCAHIHCDVTNQLHQVKVSAYPLRGSNGELYMGECIEEIVAADDQHIGGARMVGETSAFMACLNQLNIAHRSDGPVRRIHPQ